VPKNSGHLILVDEPKSSSEAILRFLAGANGAGAHAYPKEPCYGLGFLDRP
jgi:hypothetical protein